MAGILEVGTLNIKSSDNLHTLAVLNTATSDSTLDMGKIVSTSNPYTFTALQTFNAGVVANSITENGVTLTNKYVAKITSTANKLVKFSDTSSTITNSVIYDDGTNVGIGTSSPSAFLHAKKTTGVAELRAEATDVTAYAKVSLYNSAGRSLELDYISPSHSLGEMGALFVNGAYPFTIWTNSVERMRIDSSGNVGIGVTPPTGHRSSTKALDISNIGGLIGINDNAFRVMYNSYINASSQWVYKRPSLKASMYEQYNGSHAWYVSTTTGSADAAIDGTGNFTTAMTLDASSNLSVAGNLIVAGSIISNTANTGGTYGLIYNQTDDTYRRYGTGTVEDNYWIGTVGARLNDNSNSDPVTTFFNGSSTVQGQMKRVVVGADGVTVKDYNANSYTHTDQTGLTATQTVAVEIPAFYFINVSFVSGGKNYKLYLQNLKPFSVDLSKMGFAGASSISGVSTSGYESYSSISGTTITGILHRAFVPSDGLERTSLKMGAFNTYYDGTRGRSTCTVTGTSTPVIATANQTIATFRTYHSSFGAVWQTTNWLEREALMLTVLIERGSFMTETNGSSLTSKWEGNSNTYTSQSSYDQNNGLTLSLLNSTGVIRNSSGKTIANSYRGVENYHSGIWNFIDGINIINGAVYLAKHGASYASDTTSAPYFNSGVTTLTSGSGAYISNLSNGTFIPSATGASNTTKMTDGSWYSSGNRVLFVGGALGYAGLSGVFAWISYYDSSALYWNFGSRFCAL